MQWEVPPDYINVILSIKDNLTRDLVYILMAKGLHCISIKVGSHGLSSHSSLLFKLISVQNKLVLTDDLMSANTFLRTLSHVEDSKIQRFYRLYSLRLDKNKGK